MRSTLINVLFWCAALNFAVNFGITSSIIIVLASITLIIQGESTFNEHKRLLRAKGMTK